MCARDQVTAPPEVTKDGSPNRLGHGWNSGSTTEHANHVLRASVEFFHEVLLRWHGLWACIRSLNRDPSSFGQCIGEQRGRRRITSATCAVCSRRCRCSNSIICVAGHAEKVDDHSELWTIRAHMHYGEKGETYCHALT